MISHCSTTV